MVASDELENYICKKYNCDCKRCSASLYNQYGLKDECSFDKFNNCLQEYVDDRK